MTTVPVVRDNVVDPAHYQSGEVETIDRMRILYGDSSFLSYCEINIFKYTDRAPHKGKEKEDLGKAEFYRKMVKHVAKPSENPDPREARQGWKSKWVNGVWTGPKVGND